MLDSMPAIDETAYVRHVRFDNPLKIMMDGMKQEGVVIFDNQSGNETIKE